MRRINILTFLVISTCSFAQTGTRPVVKGGRNWSQQLAATAMNLWKDSFSLAPGKPAKWSYDQGVILKGIEGIWNATGDARILPVHSKMHGFLCAGRRKHQRLPADEFNIDHINNGKLILLLYRVTGKEKYKKAADLLRDATAHASTHYRRRFLA